jgi:hypothetical protein
LKLKPIVLQQHEKKEENGGTILARAYAEK